MAKKMIIKGVGSFMARKVTPTGEVEVITLGNLQDLRITFTVDIEDIFGGDGLFAIDTLVRQKAIEITATDAKFDLDAVSLMLGSTVQEQVDNYVWVLNEQATIAGGSNGSATCGVVTPQFAPTLYTTPDFSVRFVNGNKLLTKVAYEEDKAPEIGTFMVDPNTGKLYFAATDVGKDVSYSYKREETVDMTDLLTDEIPFPVTVVHHGSFQQKDGTYAGIETELYACRARGSFTINAARATASAMEVSLQVIDPERADGKMGSIKRYNTSMKV